jgi:hypothetical protein
MSKTSPDLAGALAAMRAVPLRGRGHSSSAYQWLLARHDALVAAFAESPPSWQALADYLGAHGITGADERSLTATVLRSAWQRVTANVARRRAVQPTSKPHADTARRVNLQTSRGAAEHSVDSEELPDFDKQIRAR